MERIHVIVNPCSARGQTEKRWAQIREDIKRVFREFRYVFTERPKQATDIAREVIREGADFIIGVGGDGTLNEIANGFFAPDTSSVINENASIALIPSGTGSDFIRFMKIPRDYRKSVEQLKDAPKRRVDIGKITCLSSCMESKSQHFINIADFGLGAEVIKKISSVPSGKRGAFFYYQGLLSALFKYRSRKVQVSVDDGKTIEGNFLIGAVANGGIFGGGMIIAPKARIDDGYFDLVLIEDMDKTEIIINSARLYSGSIDRHRKVHTIRAKKIKVFSAEPVPIEYDGEQGGVIPAEFKIIEKALNFRSHHQGSGLNI